MSPQQRRKPIKRAFTGLAGSPLAKITAPAPSPVPAAPVQQTTSEILVSVEVDKKNKDAERKKQERKRKREQLAAIRLALKAPVAEIKRAEEYRAKLEKLIKADKRAAERVRTGVDIDGATRAAARGEGLRTPDGSDPEFWPVNDRTRVKPEGTGDGKHKIRFTVKSQSKLHVGQALTSL